MIFIVIFIYFMIFIVRPFALFHLYIKQAIGKGRGTRKVSLYFVGLSHFEYL